MTARHTRTELLRLAADAVGVADLDPDANLFALGVDSIGLLRLVQVLEEQGYALDLVDVYQEQVVRNVLECARWTGGTSTAGRPPLVTPVWLANIRSRLIQSFPDPRQPTRHQLLDRAIPKVRVYRGTAPVKLLERNIETILRSYPQLRWSFHERAQSDITSTESVIGLDRYRLPAGASERNAVDEAVAYATAPFDVRDGRLIRFGLWEMPTGFVLALGVDHIVADGHSLEVLWRRWLAGEYGASGGSGMAQPTWDDARELSHVSMPPVPAGVRRDPGELAIELPPRSTAADSAGPAVVHRLVLAGDAASAIAELWRVRSVPHEATFVAAYACAYAELTGATEVPITRNDAHRNAGVDDDLRVGWFSGWDDLRIRTDGGLSRPEDLLEETKRQLVTASIRHAGADGGEGYVPFFNRYPDLGERHPRAEFLFRRENGAEPLPPGAHAAEPVDIEPAEPQSILGSELYVTQTGDGFTCDLMFRADRYPAELVDAFVASFRRHLTDLPRRWSSTTDGTAA